MQPVTAVVIVIAIAATLLLVHGLFSLWLMVYAWDQENLGALGGPKTFREPCFSFSVLIPARDEEAVIAETIRKAWSADYPRELLEIVVICQGDDPATIEAAKRQVKEIDSPRVRLEIYELPPFNKPHALEVGYAGARGDVITIFDAEDDMHPDIFNVINTIMLREGVGIVQSGVQLMNISDHWFSVFNCLEYFFYYQSRLHFNARAGMVPLGGNSVFIRRHLIARVGGWDVNCLTEDADLGVRLSATGERVRVVYDSRWTTREETPHTVGALVRQRTRWHQGFLQVLSKRDWQQIPGRRGRALALITFGQPLLDGLLLCCTPLVPLALLFLKLPVAVALLSFAPLYVVALQLLVNIAGAVAFARTYQLRAPRWVILRMPFTYLPYIWLIGYSALRATLRQVRGRREWEKTEHLGAHRRPLPAPAPQPVVLAEEALTG
jgi:cellulose synthase/poly-beta-1,6-N-acetylglucosamine synthase-like glycosyltransferase